MSEEVFGIPVSSSDTEGGGVGSEVAFEGEADFDFSSVAEEGFRFDDRSRFFCG